jgi:hypothetical protein
MIAELTSEQGLHNALLLKYVDEMQLLDSADRILKDIIKKLHRI